MRAQEQVPAAAPASEAQPLALSEDRFRALVEQSIAGIYVIQDGRVVYANPKFCEIFGYSREEFAQGGVPLEQLTWEQDWPMVRENVRRRLAGEVQSMHYTFRARRKDGAPIEVEVHGARTELAGNLAITGTLLDITERRRAEHALRQSEERYALAERGANDGLWDWDLAGNRVYLSPRWKQMLGLREDELGSDPEAWFERVHPDDRDRLSADVARHLSGDTPNLEVEHRIRHADGTWRWVLLRGTAVRDAQGKATRMAGSQTDVTERKEAEEKLLHDALHDALTGLANRSLFMDRLRQAMAFLQRKPDLRFAVLFLDVDRFKNINESLGHAMGDRLLVSVGKRLLGCIRPGDTVARLGGDEFALLLEDYGAPEDPARCAEHIQAELAPAHDLGGVEVFATASIGIAVAGRGYTRPEELLRDADTAMYRAKQLGRARHAVFHPAMHAHARAQLQLETDLYRALERNELRVAFQPIVSLSTGLIAGCEALVEWQHPKRGRIPPAEFIPAAEETGLILPIGEWVLRESCKAARGFADRLPRGAPIAVSVNLSARQLLRAELLEQVRSALQQSGLEPHRLRLEVTESVIMENAGPASLLLAQIKALGVHLLLDDFGTGYSSLSYLHNFRFDTLKLDRSFVARVDSSSKHAEIVRTIVSLARALGMDVVAEGVETPAQVAQLQMLHCDYAQGYYFARPLEAPQLAGLLESRRSWPLPLAPAAAMAQKRR
ncbi:MAG TPA: EAL domain-containing protein [Myxococcales bacterium]|jgi:diguanylate cyclase (GGDEF)-like protein/PAS domain S-box-containing protein|nr:EAL domain-containing protein [Myxococcales bacterium]